MTYTIKRYDTETTSRDAREIQTLTLDALRVEVMDAEKLAAHDLEAPANDPNGEFAVLTLTDAAAEAAGRKKIVFPNSNTKVFGPWGDIENERYIAVYPVGTPKRTRLETAAELLNRTFPELGEFYVAQTYFDYGQRWMWTTILCRITDKKSYSYGESVQYLYPVDQHALLYCEPSEKALKEVVTKIVKKREAD